MMLTVLFALLYCLIFVIILVIGTRRCKQTPSATDAYEKATRWQQKILKMPIQEGAIEQQKWRSYVNSIHIRKNNVRSL